MSRRISRTIAAAVAGATATLCLSGCTVPFPIAVAGPTTPPPVLPAAPSSTPLPLVPSGPAPALANTGSNWAPMLATLLTYGQWLLANPGTGAATTAAAPGCPLTELLTARMADFSSEAWRLAPAQLTISSLGVPSAPVPGQTSVDLHVVASRGMESVVDGSGQPASAIAALPPAAFDVSLNLGGDGRWRLCTIQPAEPVHTADGALQSYPSLL